MSDVEQVIPLTVQLIERDIAETVKIIEGMPRSSAAEILLMLPVELTTRILQRLQVSYTASLLDQNDPALVEKIVQRLPPRKAASVVMHLSPEGRAKLMPSVTGALASEIREMLTYPEGSVGRYMSSDFLTFQKEESAGNVIAKMKKLASEKSFPASYTYVVDDDSILLGVLNTRDLMLA
ncbi:MAG: CBS domain-containing protein, partial [Deltaproteobacteria bacterium]|nr:CBS domain-containing protein [Deltaproteobacteria bacterium]